MFVLRRHLRIPLLRAATKPRLTAQLSVRTPFKDYLAVVPDIEEDPDAFKDDVDEEVIDSEEVGEEIDLEADELAENEDPPIVADSLYPRNPITAAHSSNKSAVVKMIPKYTLHVHASPNNTIVSFTRPDGSTIGKLKEGAHIGKCTRFSGGKCGFKGVARGSYEAGYQCAMRVFQMIEEQSTKDMMQIELRLNGFGQGRDAVYRALMANEGSAVRALVTRVTDRTPIKVGGSRAKKWRRL